MQSLCLMSQSTTIIFSPQRIYWVFKWKTKGTKKSNILFSVKPLLSFHYLWATFTKNVHIWMCLKSNLTWDKLIGFPLLKSTTMLNNLSNNVAKACSSWVNKLKIVQKKRKEKLKDFQDKIWIWNPGLLFWDIGIELSILFIILKYYILYLIYLYLC